MHENPDDIIPNYVPKSRFHGEQDPRHGGPLQWPGINNFPVRGSTTKALKEGEQYNATFVKEFHCRIFDLSKEEDLKEYKWVMDRICNGLFLVTYVQRQWDARSKAMLVYLEWCQCYYEWP